MTSAAQHSPKPRISVQSVGSSYLGLTLPTSNEVQEQVAIGGDSVTFLHIALGIIDRLEEGRTPSNGDLQFLRDCLNAGLEKTQLPCMLVQGASSNDLVDSETSKAESDASSKMRPPPGGPTSASSKMAFQVRDDLRKTWTNAAAQKQTPQRNNHLMRGTLRAARHSVDKVPKLLSEGGGKQSAGLPWMGPPVPRWPVTDLSQPSAERLESLFGLGLSSWGFDVFELSGLTGGRPLQFIGWEALRRSGGFSEFCMDPQKACTFLQLVESKYANQAQAPYHNNYHAADVTQTVISILQEHGAASFFDPMDKVVVVLGASIHDMGHDGRNNAFHIAVQDDLALTYNDRSVLENFHCAESFKLLNQRPDANFLERLQKQQVAMIRREVIDMVLGTDMAHHFARVGDFGKLMRTLGDEPALWSQDESAMDVLRSMVLHSADISNPAKPWMLSREWSSRCLKEFFMQGDVERKLGLPVSPMCDRHSINVPGSQLGFINFIVQPTYEALQLLLPSVGRTCLAELMINRSAWEQRSLHEQESHEEAWEAKQEPELDETEVSVYRPPLKSTLSEARTATDDTHAPAIIDPFDPLEVHCFENIDNIDTSEILDTDRLEKRTTCHFWVQMMRWLSCTEITNIQRTHLNTEEASALQDKVSLSREP